MTFLLWERNEDLNFYFGLSESKAILKLLSIFNLFMAHNDTVSKSKERRSCQKSRKKKEEKVYCVTIFQTIVNISSLMRYARQFPPLRIIEFTKYVLCLVDSFNAPPRVFAYCIYTFFNLLSLLSNTESEALLYWPCWQESKKKRK